MKYNRIITLLILASAVSCQQEMSIDECQDNTMSCIEVGTESNSTKCNQDETTLIQDMPFVTSTGDTLYISAMLSDMDDVVVEKSEESEETQRTKSAPITSSTAIPGNKLYTFVYNDAGTYTSTVTSASMYKTPINYSSSKWSFQSTYYWPASDTEILHFVTLGPGSLVDDAYLYNLDVSGYGWNTSTKALKGRYQSRKDNTVTNNDAVNLADMVYGYDDQCKKTHINKVQLNLKHACVGVRFEVGNIFGTIAYISLDNFFKNADFTISSSGITWSGYGGSENWTTFKQVYDFVATGQESQFGTDLDNTTNHAKTFMIIPQTLTNGQQKMSIQMGNTLHPDELSFERICTENPGLSKNWVDYMGKIITFRVSSTKANNVSVAITDDVEQSTHTKQNIEISNDGRSDIMIRMKIVGNWLNEDGEVLSSWHESNPYGFFDGKNPLTDATSFPRTLPSNWVLGSDGFYYYKKYLKTGDVVSQNLFNTYQVTSKPVDATGTWEQGGTKMQIKTMELDLMVQAIIAEADLSSFTAAWGTPTVSGTSTTIVSWIGTPQRDI